MALEDWLGAAQSVADIWRGTQQSPVGFGGPMAYPAPVGNVGVGDPPDAVWRARLACKRRKRQRNILSQANIGIMWQISSLPNNANVRIALARAIR